MTPERWSEIERLYHAALERAEGERPAFLADACGSDDGLRHEVESLLAYESRAAEFLESAPEGLSGVRSPIIAALRSGAMMPGRFAGRTLGAYRVESLIAAGGMGEVYRAIDTRLDRVVAIKTLGDPRAADPERQQRFRREARIISSLNHPHICTLYDVGTDEDGVEYIVMEYVDGETLEARLKRGALPIRESLEYMVQIADALDKAHRQGIIHRDLKPGNVMLTRSGVKLLDFGLASRPDVLDGAPGLTIDGTILGTAPYAAPEQLEGRAADARTDIFAFGAVAYEMLTGRAAFQRENRAQVISAVLTGSPTPLEDLVPAAPAALTAAVERCLAKAPDERWQSAHDLLFHLESIDPSAAPARAHRAVRRAARAALVLAGVAVLVALGWLWAKGTPGASRPDAPVIRFAVSPVDGTAFYPGYDLPFALSPDGRFLVYVATAAGGNRRLWLRPLESEQAEPIPGTDGASTPFWSPDGEWVAFFAGRNLKKVRITGGSPVVIAANVSTFAGAAWGRSGAIVFPESPGGLSRVSAQGGPVTPMTKSDAATAPGGHFWPQFLDDGEHVLFAAPAAAALYVTSLSNPMPRRLMKFPSRTSSIGYARGYVFYVQDAALFARPFDETRLEFTGEPVRLLHGIPVAGIGRAAFSVSGTGPIAFWPYGVGTPAVLQWFDRAGRPGNTIGGAGQYVGFALSPDEQRLLFARNDANGSPDLWRRDLATGREAPMTVNAIAAVPQWSPDGARAVFSGPAGVPPPKLLITHVDDPTDPQPLDNGTRPEFPSSWSTDESIVSVRIDPVTRLDLWVHRNASAEPLPLNTPFDESHGQVSPDSRWIAYVTNQSGRNEVWVASFPSGRTRRQVSAGGGSAPQWGRNEIFYLTDDRQLMAAAVRASDAGIDVDRPAPLFRLDGLADAERADMPNTNAYVAASGGQRFLAAIASRNAPVPPISIFADWRSLAKR